MMHEEFINSSCRVKIDILCTLFKGFSRQFLHNELWVNLETIVLYKCKNSISTIANGSISMKIWQFFEYFRTLCMCNLSMQSRRPISTTEARVERLVLLMGGDRKSRWRWCSSWLLLTSNVTIRTSQRQKRWFSH